MSTPQQIAANQTNAQLSTGPRTEDGKAVSSRNALANGLTGRTVLLPSDDLDEYALNLARHFGEFLPVNSAETELVQAIADCEWRLNRVLVIEEGLFAQGAREFADAYPHEPRAVRSVLINTQTYLKYERQLKNLSVQEGRLQRKKDKCIAAFEEMKKQRPKPAAKPEAIATESAIGFEFSTPAAPAATGTSNMIVAAPSQANVTAPDSPDRS